MKRSFWKSLLTFLLVLALTAGTVSALSMATAAKSETAPARYSQQVRENEIPEATELSADVREDSLSVAASLGAFLVILLVPGVGALLYVRSRKKGCGETSRRGRRYSPRADMAFQSASFVKRV